jgi:hypothetical protein
MEGHGVQVKMFDFNPDNKPTIYEHFAPSESVSPHIHFFTYISQRHAGIP